MTVPWVIILLTTIGFLLVMAYLYDRERYQRKSDAFDARAFKKAVSVAVRELHKDPGNQTCRVVAEFLSSQMPHTGDRPPAGTYTISKGDREVPREGSYSCADNGHQYTDSDRCVVCGHQWDDEIIQFRREDAMGVVNDNTTQQDVLLRIAREVVVMPADMLDSLGRCDECGMRFPHRGSCSRSVALSGQAWVPPDWSRP